MIYPFVKDGVCHYRDAGYFNEERRRIKRWFPVDQYAGHTPHSRYEQIIMVKYANGNLRMLSAMGHFLEFERLLHVDLQAN